MYNGELAPRSPRAVTFLVFHARPGRQMMYDCGARVSGTGRHWPSGPMGRTLDRILTHERMVRLPPSMQSAV